MAKSKLKFSKSIDDRAKEELTTKVETVLGHRSAGAGHQVSYYQDVLNKKIKPSIVFFDKSPVPKNIDLSSFERMVFTNEPNQLAQEIALAHICEEEKFLDPKYFFSGPFLIQKKFELKSKKDLREIEDFLDEHLDGHSHIKALMNTALFELVNNAFDQIEKSTTQNLVQVEIIHSQGNQWACKIKDYLGTLDYEKFTKNFAVYKDEKLQINRETKGAGFGLGLVMSLASRLYVMVKKDVTTEILFIYDPNSKIKRSFQFFEI
jgi:anti-sigma regulatory factor (Ser/Thr protein kinase)